MINRNQLTGFEAFSKFLEITFHNGGEVWPKVSHNIFFKGSVGKGTGGLTELYSTKGADKDRTTDKKIEHPYEYLRGLSETKDGGVFFIPAKPQGAPIKDCVKVCDLLSIEMDGGSTEEQWERLNQFSEVSGLIWSVIVGSGSKSLHGHIVLESLILVEERTHLQRLLAIWMLGDPAVCNPHQPMRLPGFFRKEKNREQPLVSYCDKRYSPDEIWGGLKNAFEAEGYQFYQDFSDERWGKLRRVIANQKLKGYTPLTPEEQKAEIKRILALSEEEINPPKTPRLKFNLTKNGGIDGGIDWDSIKGFNPKVTPKAIDFTYGGDIIPLEYFLFKIWQDYIVSGIPAAGEGRNPVALKMAGVLLNHEEILQDLGIKYSGNTYDLVSQFCANCTPPLTQSQADSIYRSALTKPSRRATIDESDVKAKIFYWQNPNKSKLITQQDWKKQRAYAAKIAWKNNKKYTPDVTYSEPHCTSPMAPNQGEIVALKYGTGQGKSTKIKSWFANELKDFGAIKLGSRNSLEYQFARSSDFTHLKDDGQTFILDPKGRTTSCIDSILKYDDDHFDGKVLVLDEIESLTRHSLYGGTLKERQQQVIDKFRIALQRCHSIILADGNLSDHVCNFIQKLSGKKLIKYYNDVIPLRPNVTFYDDMDRNFSAKLSHQIKGEAFPWVMLDSQVDCESMDKDLTRYGRKVLRIDSKTINDPILGNETKQFLSNPDLFLLENEVTKTYDVILSTPTVESGLDCNYKGFSGVYLLCKHLEINSLLQMIIRVRDVNCPRYVCAPKYVKQSDDSAIKSPFIKTLSQLEIDLQKKSVEALGSELGMYQDEIKARLIQHINDSYSSPEQDLFNVFNTIKNYEHSRYRECLIESLSQSGYKVTFEQIGKPIMTQFKECKIEVKESVASDVSSADKIDENQYKKLSKRQDLKWLDRCSVTKYRLLERLPGVEGLGWDKDLVFHLLFSNKKLISQAEIRWMLSNPELAVKRSQKAWHGVLKYNKTFLGNFKTLLPVVKELNRLDVPKLMDKLTTIYYNSDYPEVKALWDGWGRTQVTRTGIERGGTPVMLIKRLAAKLGYETVESGAIWVNGATVKNYILNDLMSTSQYGIIVAGCVSERLENENLDPGIGDSDWLEILHPESLETIHSMQSIPYKPIHYTIDINDTVCKASNPDTISNTAITNVENQQTTPEPIPELITAQTTTPEPEPEPEPLSWKGATGRIKPEIAPYWLEVYKIYKESNPLTRSGARVKSVDSAPTWKHNAMAPNGGGWMLLVEIEGLIGTKINVPMDCLEFEG